MCVNTHQLFAFYNHVALTTMLLCSLSFVTVHSGNRMKSFVWSRSFTNTRANLIERMSWKFRILRIKSLSLSMVNKTVIFDKSLWWHLWMYHLRTPWCLFCITACLYSQGEAWKSLGGCAPLILGKKWNMAVASA